MTVIFLFNFFNKINASFNVYTVKKEEKVV